MSEARSSRRSRRLQLLRYLVAGSVLFLLDFLVVLSLIRFNDVNPAIAQLIGRSTGAIAGFILHRNFTFSDYLDGSQLSVTHQGTGYLSIAMTTLIASPFILVGALAVVGDHILYAKVLTEIVLVAINFVLMKQLFRARRDLFQRRGSSDV